MKSDSPILHGLVYCIHCGNRLMAHNRPGGGNPDPQNHTYYNHLRDPGQCPSEGKSIRADEVDERVWQDLSEFFVLSDSQKEHIARMAEATKKPLADPISRRRAQIKVRLENLEDGFLDGVIPKDRYRQLKAELEAELESLPEPTTQAQPIMTYDDALERLGAITQLLKEHMLVNPERVNRIFRAMMSAVWVDIETGQVAAYTPKSWCAAQFPPDKVRAIQEDKLGKRLPGDQLFGDLGSEHK